MRHYIAERERILGGERARETIRDVRLDFQRFVRIAVAARQRELFQFAVPARPGNLPVRISLDSGNTFGIPFQLVQDGGSPSMTLWQYSEPGTSRALQFKASTQAVDRNLPTIDITLAPGTYVIELAPTGAVARPQDHYKITAAVPSGQHQYDDVQKFGSLGDGTAQLTLNEFVRARANDHLDYPYLTWTSDQCTMSRDERSYSVVLDGVVVRRTVPVYKACWRHDFSWRNLPRIQHQVDSGVHSWTAATKDEADAQLGEDIRSLCDEFLSGTDWQLARDNCHDVAARYQTVVSMIALEGVNTDSPIGPPGRTE